LAYQATIGDGIEEGALVTFHYIGIQSRFIILGFVKYSPIEVDEQSAADLRVLGEFLAVLR